MRPITLLSKSVNHRLPSGPEVIMRVLSPCVREVRNDPPVVMRPIDWMPSLAHQIAPSGPVVIDLYR